VPYLRLKIKTAKDAKSAKGSIKTVTSTASFFPFLAHLAVPLFYFELLKTLALGNNAFQAFFVVLVVSSWFISLRLQRVVRRGRRR